MYQTVNDIRQYFIDELQNKRFTEDRTGQKTIELLGASFIANELAIFGNPNQEYIDHELKWYRSESTNINDIYGNGREPPKAWQMSANAHGEINSNYGKLVYSALYYNQFRNALYELQRNPDSRRASMIYTRPSIWEEYNENGKSDFICTNSVTYYIRDGLMHSVVQMRSNDCWAGYRNDVAWQNHVLGEIVDYYNLANFDNNSIKKGYIYWQVQNLHCYQRNFYLIDAYSKGHATITKTEYRKLYPNSKYL